MNGRQGPGRHDFGGMSSGSRDPRPPSPTKNGQGNVQWKLEKHRPHQREINIDDSLETDLDEINIKDVEDDVFGTRGDDGIDFETYDTELSGDFPFDRHSLSPNQSSTYSNAAWREQLRYWLNNRWFTIELILQLACCPTIAAAFSVERLIDFLTVLPFYIDIVRAASTGRTLYGTTYEIEGGAWVRIIDLGRLLRLFRLFPKSGKLRMMGRAFYGLWLLFILIPLLVLLFSVLLFYSEQTGEWFDDKTRLWYYVNSGKVSPFQSIPDCFWFVLVTLTTIGYGDVVPVTLAGRILSSALMITSLFLVAFPLTMITSQYTLVANRYAEQRSLARMQRAERRRRREKQRQEHLSRAVATSEGSLVESFKNKVKELVTRAPSEDSQQQRPDPLRFTRSMTEPVESSKTVNNWGSLRASANRLKGKASDSPLARLVYARPSGDGSSARFGSERELGSHSLSVLHPQVAVGPGNIIPGLPPDDLSRPRVLRQSSSTPDLLSLARASPKPPQQPTNNTARPTTPDPTDAPQTKSILIASEPRSTWPSAGTGAMIQIALDPGLAPATIPARHDFQFLYNSDGTVSRIQIRYTDPAQIDEVIRALNAIVPR
ncbi:Solute carrier 49 member 4 [Geranomyces variabilis]|uniref:Solute carrier 49 member 4 n=1 Tax=Geranomyces variabilis TaxID=109894 RepID=A0AAD5TQ72_9FUNG|nr:Solute carrier 49 member 4 [Geranomyces variabilis]